MSDDKKIDKLPLKSKKFLAYMLADFGWKAIIFYQISHLEGKLTSTELAFLMTTVITAGAIQIGYILGVASLEKYLSAASSILDKEKDETKKK